MKNQILLFEALKRAFTGQTTLIPAEKIELRDEPTEKGSVPIGSIAEGSILHALFCEWLLALSTFAVLSEKIEDDDNLMVDFGAINEALRFQSEVVNPIEQSIWAGILVKFPELEGHGAEIVSGLRVCMYPIAQSKITTKWCPNLRFLRVGP